MGSPEVGVIVNPKSAAGRGLRLLPRVVNALQEEDRTFHIHATRGPGDATTIAREFAESGIPLVIAVGGDGTVNEVANGLVASGQPTCLGVVPAGRGSDFSRALGSSRKPEEAVRQILAGKPRPVDVARASFEDGTSRLFVNAGGLGFDAAVAERSNRSRMPGSTIPYLSGLIGGLISYENMTATVSVDGEEMTGPVISVLVANSSYLAGGMRVAPNADIADGLLDLAIIGDLTKSDFIAQVPKVYRGTHVNHPKFLLRRVQSVRIATERPARVQLDGELYGEAPVTITVEPGRLLVSP